MSANTTLVPSTVDFIRIRRSHLTRGIKVVRGEKVEIVDSSIGSDVFSEPGVTIRDANVPPLSHVENDIHAGDAFHPARQRESFWRILRSEIVVIPMLTCFFVALMPPYEVVMKVIDSQSQSLLALICATFCSLITFYGSSLALLLLWQMVAFSTSSSVARVPYSAYTVLERNILKHGIWSTLCGTRYSKPIMKLLGSVVKGQVLVFGDAIEDFPLLWFARNSICDHCHVSGHSVTNRGIVLKPTFVQGLVHQSCFVMSTACGDATEKGPYRAIIVEEASPNIALM